MTEYKKVPLSGPMAQTTVTQTGKKTKHTMKFSDITKTALPWTPKETGTHSPVKIDFTSCARRH